MQRLLIVLAGLLLSSHVLAVEIDFERLKGKVVYLDFWASWCGPCRSSFPWMEKMHQQYAAQGLEIIAINMDQETQLAKVFLQHFPASFRINYDPQGRLAEKFNVDAMPTSFLIDREGRVTIKHRGFKTGELVNYETEIQQLLGVL